MSRKTFEVKSLVDRVNFFNKNSSDTPENRAARDALNNLLEGVLFDTNNYHGYRYLDRPSFSSTDSRREYYFK